MQYPPLETAVYFLTKDMCVKYLIVQCFNEYIIKVFGFFIFRWLQEQRRYLLVVYQRQQQ